MLELKHITKVYEIGDFKQKALDNIKNNKPLHTDF